MHPSLRDEILDLSRQAQTSPLSSWFDSALDRAIAAGHFPDQDQVANLGNALIDDLRGYSADHGVKTVTIGMSGGVDSALTAALFKAAGWRVIGHTMPIEQDPEETRRGIEACEALGIEHVHVDLTDQYRLMVVGLGRHDQQLNEAGDQAVDIRRGNIRARLRMVTLYDQAHRYGGLVASTDNFSELAAGFWTLHGDVGDVAPIQPLLKSWEVPLLSREAGVPESTWRAKPTDGLGISDGDEAQLGATYLEWDLMLVHLIDAVEGGMKTPQLNDLPRALGLTEDAHAQQVFKALTGRMGRTWFKRAGTVCLPHTSANRYEGLQELDRVLLGA